MIYFTKFSLSITMHPNSLAGLLDIDIIKELRSSIPVADQAIDEFGTSLYSCVWTNHVEDMIFFSKNYPSVVFSLHGDGEVDSDVWYKHFKNGEMQEAFGRTVYDDCIFVPDAPIAQDIENAERVKIIEFVKKEIDTASIQSLRSIHNIVIQS